MVNVKHSGTPSIEETESDNSSGAGSRNKVAMTTLGKIGFFGDQIIQYAFLRVYANIYSLDVEVPDWDGRVLFGLKDYGLSNDGARHVDDRLFLGMDAMVPVIADYLGVNWKNLLGFWIKRQNISVSEVAVDFLKGEDILPGNKGKPCGELLGWFLFHTRFYSPHKKFILSLFRPVKTLENSLLQAWSHVSSRGNTLIGIHLRRGDRLNIPLNTNEWIAPVEWYLQWLEGNWHTFDKPVLFLASDSINQVRGYFSKYEPVTTHDILKGLPVVSSLSGDSRTVPPYYPDFFFLSLCDIVATANSMFSFTSSMLNDRGRLFLRPVLDKRRLVPFDPWNSKPILRRRMYTSFFQRYREYVRLSYLAGGMAEVQKSLLVRIPKFWLLRCAINIMTKFYRSRVSFSLTSY